MEPSAPQAALANWAEATGPGRRGTSDLRGFVEHPERMPVSECSERTRVNLKHKSTFGTC